MDAENPSGVDLVAFGPGAAYLARKIIRDRYVPEELWTCNDAHRFWNMKPDRIVAMDDLELDEVTHPEYVEDIVEAGCPVITSTAYPQWPTTEAYPLKEVLAYLDLSPEWGGKILTNTLCYMLALAVCRGRSPIALWGFDFYREDTRQALTAGKIRVPPGKPDWQKYYRKPLIRQTLEPGSDGLSWLLGWVSRHGKNNIKINTPTTILDIDRPAFYYGYRKDPLECSDTAIYAATPPRSISDKTNE